MQPAVLVLKDGSVFRGRGIGAPGQATGEVVFNTAMTGYQEILTDPSYAGQMVTLTYPHIGNTGCNTVDEEAPGPMAAALIIRDYPELASSWRRETDLRDYLNHTGVPAIAEVDTRRLTRHLRDQGAQPGCLLSGEEAAGDAGIEQALAAARACPGMRGRDLAREVSTTAPYQWWQGSLDLDRQEIFELDPDQARFHVVAYDFGCKRNILRLLCDRRCRVTVVPADTPAQAVLERQPDGVFFSNGPGDPEPCDYAVTAARRFIEVGIPLFGICLGHQLLALAAGASTVKMKFGHHGANHPVQELASGRVMITSQNHGFAVDEDSLPDHVTTTHRSLFDGSLQGIALDNAPAFGFQGHPEGSPGPHDIHGLFDHFVQLMQDHPVREVQDAKA